MVSIKQHSENGLPENYLERRTLEFAARFSEMIHGMYCNPFLYWMVMLMCVVPAIFRTYLSGTPFGASGAIVQFIGHSTLALPFYRRNPQSRRFLFHVNMISVLAGFGLLLEAYVLIDRMPADFFQMTVGLQVMGFWVESYSTKFWLRSLRSFLVTIVTLGLFLPMAPAEHWAFYTYSVIAFSIFGSMISYLMHSRFEMRFVQECARNDLVDKNKELSESYAHIEEIFKQIPHAAVKLELDENQDIVFSDVRSPETNLIFDIDTGSGKVSFTKTLEAKCLIGKQELSEFLSALHAILDDDPIAFDLNAHKLPRKIRLQARHASKDIELSWQRLSDFGNEHKSIILLSATDRTAESIAVADLRRRNTEVEALYGFYKLGRRSSRQVLKSLSSNLEAAGALLDANPGKAELQRLMMLVHTIKGEALFPGLNVLAEAAHQMEKDISLAIESGNHSELGWIVTIEVLQNITLQYQEIFYRMFSGEENEAGDESIAMQEIVEKMRQRAGLLAQKMEIPSPLVEAEGPARSLSPELAQILENSLLHLLTNSLCHGIESPLMRMRSGKSEEGLIVMRWFESVDDFVLEWSDDGRGLDLHKIREMALAKGLPSHADDDAALANLILSHSFTTKNQASLYSGRGVGLSAVTDAMANLNGIVSVKLGEILPNNNRSFSLRLSIPMQRKMHSVA